MGTVKAYFATTLWRAILELVTVAALGVAWLVNSGSSVVMGLFIGACVLWAVDGCDHGIDAIRARAARRRSSAGTASTR